jgi:hypothetical protein
MILQTSKYAIICLLLAASISLATNVSAQISTNINVEVHQSYNFAASRLSPFLTNEEREIAANIEFKYSHHPGDGTIAFIDPDSGRKTIGFSINDYLEFRLLGSLVGTSMLHPRSGDILDGYIQYLAWRSIFTVNQEKFMSPVEFIDYFDPGFSETLSPSQADLSRGLSLFVSDGIIEFVLAHELAHHILGHVGTNEKSPEKFRQEEFEADEWATKLLLKSGNPVPNAAILFQFLHEKQYRDIKVDFGAKHPSALNRAIRVLQLHKSEVTKWRRSAETRYLQIGVPYDHEATKITIDRSLATVEKELALIKMVNDNPSALINLAQSGDKYYQHLLATSYSHELNGFTADFSKSVEWHSEILSSEHKFAYSQIAFANYSLGYFHAFHKKFIAKYGKNISKAKQYLKKSAAMGYNVRAYELLTENE